MRGCIVRIMVIMIFFKTNPTRSKGASICLARSSDPHGNPYAKVHLRLRRSILRPTVEANHVDQASRLLHPCNTSHRQEEKHRPHLHSLVYSLASSRHCTARACGQFLCRRREETAVRTVRLQHRHFGGICSAHCYGCIRTRYITSLMLQFTLLTVYRLQGHHRYPGFGRGPSAHRRTCSNRNSVFRRCVKRRSPIITAYILQDNPPTTLPTSWSGSRL